MGRKHDRVAAAVFAEVDGVVRVLLVHDRDGRWILPKGRVDRGEGPVDAAGREAREEGAVAAVIDPDARATWKHRTRRGRRQRVRVYRGRALRVTEDRPEPWRRPTWVAMDQVATLTGTKHYERLYRVLRELVPERARAFEAGETAIA